MDDLEELGAVVRRVVSARVRDRHLVEDLTQETLVHVAAADPRLGPGARQAYAIVTARNLVISHARSEAVHDRHAHRLVEYNNLDGPEELSLEREETAALAEALQRLGDEDRRLLVRHEADGTSIDTLAAEDASSRGAIAMRLARARALLRVEFLLAFRRVELPTQRCRPVLLALSAGDRRAQDRLGAAAHLLRCRACAHLAPPVTERRRGIAVVLLGLLAEGVRRGVSAVRHNGVTQAATATLASIGVVVAIAATRADSPEPTADAPVTAEATSSTAAPTSTTTTTTSPTTPAAPCPPPAPLGPQSAPDCPIAPTEVTAVDVVADEGFWARTGDGQSIWIHLVGEGESPTKVDVGATLRVGGTLRTPAADSPVATDPRMAPSGHVLEVPYDSIEPG